MNTHIEYMYRDGENYKLFHEVILAGEVSLEQLQTYFYEGDFFVPSVVGLEDLQETPYRECDHVWHEIEGAELTTNPPTASISAVGLLQRFRAAGTVKWKTKSTLRRMLEIEGRCANGW